MTNPNPTHTQYDIYISHGDEELSLAKRLRADLGVAGFHIYPDSTLTKTALATCRMILALQTGKKAGDAVRAAIAVAQQLDIPILTVYVKNDQLALRQSGRDALFDDTYGQGIVNLVYALWVALEDPRGETSVNNPIETGEDPLEWLARLTAHKTEQDNQHERD